MSRWFRWYEGTVEDAKFRVIARMSRVTCRDVIALWAFMLEDAAHLDHRGVCERNEDFMSATLDFDDGVVERILEAMEDLKMISVGHGAITITNWDKRQFEGDVDRTASRRQREKRERDAKRESPVSHEHVTRDTGGSDTDTDTDTEAEKKKETREVALVSENSLGFKPFWEEWPNKVGKPAAWKAFIAAVRRGADPNEIIAGVKNYIRDKPPDRPWLNPATFLNQNRWEDRPAQVQHGRIQKTQSLSEVARRLAEDGISFGAKPSAPSVLSFPSGADVRLLPESGGERSGDLCSGDGIGPKRISAGGD